MKICYIKEKEETCDFVKRIILRIKRYFNIIEVKESEEKLIYNLPIFKNTKLSKYRINKLCKKIADKLNNQGITNIVLSKHLETVKLLKLKLYCKNLNILDGRLLFKSLIYEIIEYILKIKGKKIEERRYHSIS